MVLSSKKRGALLLAVSIVLSGCGQSAAPGSQTAAKVNQDEITVHQVNAALAQYPALSPEQQKKAARQVLDRLVDQELLVQKAVDQKLDRDPRVVQALESYKRGLLAQAYIDSLSAAQPAPNPEDLRKFYVAHPELFAERRIYDLQELSIPKTQPLQHAAFEQQLAKAQSLADVAQWLKEQNIDFTSSSSIKAAEALPLDLAAKMQNQQDGRLVYYTTPQALTVLYVEDSKREPMHLEQASPFIERYLLNQRKMELARNEVAALKSTAKIEYVGQFGAAPGTPAQQEAKVAEAPEKSARDASVQRGRTGLH